MGALTGSIGKSIKHIPASEQSNIKKILISRPNHRLGNLLLVTPVIDEIERLFPDSTIDVFIKGNLGPIVLQEYQSVQGYLKLPKNHFKQLPLYVWTWLKIPFKKYDLALNIDPSSSSGKLATKLSRAKYKIYGIEPNLCPQTCGTHMAQRPVNWLRQYFSDKQNKSETIAPLNLRLTTPEIRNGKTRLLRLVENNKPTIALFTYATGNKCYSKFWWKPFYNELTKAFPEYNIVEVLPKENISQLDFMSLTYYSQDLREICSFIANTELFIGADSGMMHLAVASKTPVIGLFSVTNPEIYKPYGENNHIFNPEKHTIADGIAMATSILKPVYAMEA